MKIPFKRHYNKIQINPIETFLNFIKSSRPQSYVRLANDDWAKEYSDQCNLICTQIRNDNFLNEWTSEIERLTAPGDTVLEIGCALGATSLYLAKRGRIVTGLDYSQKMCDSFISNAASLGLSVNSVCADITKTLPIPDNAFDIVWHAGVIEHFSDDEAQFIIRENARVARKCVISMAPNAASIAYRIGKEYAERTGGWRAGEEHPKYTQKDLFINAGLHNIREYSIDMNFALAFLPPGQLRDVLGDIYHNLPTSDDIHQGYLLVTIGYKN